MFRFTSVFLFSFIILLSASLANAGSNTRVAPKPACSQFVTQTMIPLDRKTSHRDLCLNDYLSKRDFACISLQESRSGDLMAVADDHNIDYDDKFVFTSTASNTKSDVESKTTDLIGDVPSRTVWLQKFYGLFLQSLKNEFGHCELQISGDGHAIGPADFKFKQRNGPGIEGTRMTLTKEDVQGANWQLFCPTADGKMAIKKSGQYFFIFMDVYKNVGDPKVLEGFAKYLFALR